MTRRIITARERVEMLSPWRTAAAYPSTYDQDHPLGQIASSHPNVDLDAWESPQGIKLNMIQVSPEHQGKGYAGAALRDLTGYADSQGVPMALTVGVPEGRKGLSQSMLKRWYSSHGFVPNKGRNKDWNWAESMIRPARVDQGHTAGRRMVAERADDFRWERSFDGGGGWILVTRTPDGNPVTVKTEPTRGQRSSARRTGTQTFPYLRNNGGMRQVPGFDQHLEPWGRYMSHDIDEHRLPLQRGWERGTVSFDNPLYVPHQYGAWKQTLSDQYGTTGQQLSEKLMADGYDGVITHDKYGIGEMVDIRPKSQRGHRTAEKTLEQHLRDTYEPHPPGDPGLPESLVPHLMLPTDVAHHYREYDRPVDDENTQMLRRVIADQGIRQPLRISTDGTHAMLIEGNHRINVARSLGMSHVPVQVHLEKPGEVMTNSTDSKPVPLEPVLGDWVRQNGHNLKSFWD